MPSPTVGGHEQQLAVATGWHRLAGLLVILLVSAVAVVGASVDNPNRVQADTSSYAFQVLLRAGRSAPAAVGEVAAWHCPRQHNTSVQDCAASMQLRPDPRYTAFFASRPLWVWSAVPFVRAQGLDGLYTVTAVWAFLLAVVCCLVVRDLGAGVVGGVISVVVLFAGPAGRIATTLLPEGAVLVALLVATAGARRMLLGLPHGSALTAGALAAAYLLKSSNGATAAFGIGCVAIGVAVVALLRRAAPGRRDTVRRAAGLAGISAVISAGWFLLARIAGYSGLHATLEDLRTWHFHRVPTQSAWQVLRTRNRLSEFWWLDLLRPPVLPVVAVLSIVVLLVVLRSGRTAALWVAVAFSGVPLCLLHPVWSNFPRLLVPFWLLPAAAAGTLAAELLRRIHLRRSEEPAPS